eukprot:4344762-Pyramimonas_sp.AAC.1
MSKCPPGVGLCRAPTRNASRDFTRLTFFVTTTSPPVATNNVCVTQESFIVGAPSLNEACWRSYSVRRYCGRYCPTSRRAWRDIARVKLQLNLRSSKRGCSRYWHESAPESTREN